MKKITKVLMIGLASLFTLSFFGCGNTTTTPPDMGNNNTPNSISLDDLSNDCKESLNDTKLEKENLSGTWDCVQKVENKTIGTSADAPTGTLIVTGILTLEKTDEQTYKAYYASGRQMILEFTSDTEFTDTQKQIIESNLSSVNISRAASSRAVSYSNGNKTAKTTITLSENKAFKSNGTTNSLTTPVKIKEIIGDDVTTNDDMTKFSGDKLGFVQRTSDEIAEFEASIERAISAAQKDCKLDSSLDSIAEGEWEVFAKEVFNDGEGVQSWHEVIYIKIENDKYKFNYKEGSERICLTRFINSMSEEDKFSFSSEGKWFDDDRVCYDKYICDDDYPYITIVNELSWKDIKNYVFVANDEDYISVNSNKTKYYYHHHIEDGGQNGDEKWDRYTVLIKRN